MSTKDLEYYINSVAKSVTKLERINTHYERISDGKQRHILSANLS